MNKKLARHDQENTIYRNVKRMEDLFSESGYSINNPLDEPYTDTRTDVDAEISGEINRPLYISEVLKPVILKEGKLIQKGLVIVEN